MSNTNIFEQITRKGLTFSTVKGNISVQELWKLPLKGKNGYDLDTISRDLLSKVRDMEQESLVEISYNVNSNDQLRLEVLKIIINTLKAEADSKVQEQITRSHNEKIDKLIAQKKEHELQNKTIEELEAMKK